MNEIESKVTDRMEKSITAMNSEIAKIRTGRAHPSLLDHVKVEYYGNKVPLDQTASITAEDAKTLMLNVWEKPMVELIEKAIADAGLGLNPAVNGTVIHVPVPPLTEERRKEMVKLVRHHGEAAKVSIRNIRRDINQHIKDALKAKDISQDQEKAQERQVQKLTDDYIARIDSVIADKEKELMGV